MQSPVTIPQIFQSNPMSECDSVINSPEIDEIKQYKEHGNKLLDSTNPSPGDNNYNQNLSSAGFQSD